MIKIEGISIPFKCHRSPTDRLREIILCWENLTDFAALDTISFHVSNSGVHWLIGQNGVCC